jgi:hypothetical protein
VGRAARLDKRVVLATVSTEQADDVSGGAWVMEAQGADAVRGFELLPPADTNSVVYGFGDDQSSSQTPE